MASDKIEVYSASASIVALVLQNIVRFGFCLRLNLFILNHPTEPHLHIIVSLTLKVHLCLKYLILSTYTSAIYATICVLPDS